MGHKGDMEVRYFTNKRRLLTDLIEDMRNAFAASVEYLETALRWTISYPRERVVPKER